jgi:hypothetical protein
MGKDEEEGRMMIGWIFLIKFDLPSEIVSGVVEGMDFVYPEGLLIKGIKPQSKTHHQTKKEHKNLSGSRFSHSNGLIWV